MSGSLWTNGVGRPLLIGLCLVSLSGTLLMAGERVSVDSPKRAWGTEQLLGEPDTMAAGDIQTAWASLTPDGKREWIIVGYADAVSARTISIHETYNPGAVDRVTAFDPDGNEVVAWEGEDPTPKGSGKGISVIPVRLDFPVRQFKIYIDSPAVSGWNEIDAVGLTSVDGETQWAVEAEASTTYAAQSSAPATVPAAATVQRIQELEAEVKALREEVDRLKSIEAELKEIRKLLEDR
ncbi:bZIP transcription factor [Maioricimonas sp. JC845]|uniref:bZIP transcription factor n=1 Tax=Maioricimonas sp. JC845 TaxID=3232138 RepID=UPI00345827E6